jgi:hypothetical protein
VKPDSLSRLYSSFATPSVTENLFPTSCLAATVDWGIETLVRKAQCSQPGPEEGPANWMFVPNSVRRTLGPDVCPPLSTYLEKSQGGYSQEQLQVLSTGGPSLDPSFQLPYCAEGMAFHLGFAPSDRVPKAVSLFHFPTPEY